MTSKEIIESYALSFLGLPYRWGGDDPIAGFDCSGLVIEILQAAGVFPRGRDLTASGLANFYAVEKSPKFGALVFYGKPKITHVGFCLNSELMLEAGGGGSKTNTEKDAEAQNAFIRIRPIASRSDIAGYRYPDYSWKD